MSWTHCPIDEVPAEVLAEKPPTPRKRTLARKKRDYERHLMRWGCHLDAAARAGVDPRTARRWREDDPEFARRCDASLSIYIERVEEEASVRATRLQVRAIWYRGRQISHVRRLNDTMLMRLLRRLPMKPGQDL
jgi:hypothetical protein